MDYKYYIGLDAHSTNCFFVVMNGRGKILRKAKVKTCERDLVEYLEGLRGSKALTFEETTVSQWLYVLLKEKVDKLVVCNPVFNKKRGCAKTDFLDATELAKLLRMDDLKPVFHADDELMSLRKLRFARRPSNPMKCQLCNQVRGESSEDSCVQLWKDALSGNKSCASQHRRAVFS